MRPIVPPAGYRSAYAFQRLISRVRAASRSASVSWVEPRKNVNGRRVPVVPGEVSDEGKVSESVTGATGSLPQRALGVPSQNLSASSGENPEYASSLSKVNTEWHYTLTRRTLD